MCQEKATDRLDDRTRQRLVTKAYFAQTPLDTGAPPVPPASGTRTTEGTHLILPDPEHPDYEKLPHPNDKDYHDRLSLAFETAWKDAALWLAEVTDAGRTYLNVPLLMVLLFMLWGVANYHEYVEESRRYLLGEMERAIKLQELGGPVSALSAPFHRAWSAMALRAESLVPWRIDGWLHAWDWARLPLYPLIAPTVLSILLYGVREFGIQCTLQYHYRLKRKQREEAKEKTEAQAAKDKEAAGKGKNVDQNPDTVLDVKAIVYDQAEVNLGVDLTASDSSQILISSEPITPKPEPDKVETEREKDDKEDYEILKRLHSLEDQANRFYGWISNFISSGVIDLLWKAVPRPTFTVHCAMGVLYYAIRRFTRKLHVYMKHVARFTGQLLHLPPRYIVWLGSGLYWVLFVFVTLMHDLLPDAFTAWRKETAPLVRYCLARKQYMLSAHSLSMDCIMRERNALCQQHARLVEWIASPAYEAIATATPLLLALAIVLLHQCTLPTGKGAFSASSSASWPVRVIQVWWIYFKKDFSTIFIKLVIFRMAWDRLFPESKWNLPIIKNLPGAIDPILQEAAELITGIW